GPQPIDQARSSLTAADDRERNEQLPVESRNYLNFTLLAPGVSSSTQQPGRRSLAPLADSGFSFGGLRGRSNNVTIDGLDNNDEYLGAVVLRSADGEITEIPPDLFSDALRHERIRIIGERNATDAEIKERLLSAKEAD